jgi:site-specific DNA-methyltransferase (adenine-specific)
MKIELNKIYCADCLEIMKQIPDKSIDLVLTDPPYGIWEDIRSADDSWRKERKQENRWDLDIPSEEYFKEIFRISKNQIIWWWNYFIEYLYNTRCYLIWDKVQDFTGADSELAWTSFNKSAKHYRLSRIEFHWWEKKYHPTQKPVWLFRWILENYSEKWQTILDPFLWSWTTAVACKEMWRNFIGIEKEQKYVDIANKRLATTTISLF